MGYSLKSVPFFSEDITIQPHTISRDAFVMAEQYLGREVSIGQFSNGQPCSLEVIEETGEYFVRRQDGAFMQGPEI